MKRTAAVAFVTSASIVTAAIALGTSLAHRAAKNAPKPGVTEPFTVAMSCDSQVIYSESCQYDAPANLGDPTTSHCSFTIDCCGAVVQSWEKDFYEEEGRGRFGLVKKHLTFSCKASPNDVDNDGIANYHDEFPAEPDPKAVAVLVPPPAPAATETVLPPESPAPTPTPETPFYIQTR